MRTNGGSGKEFSRWDGLDLMMMNLACGWRDRGSQEGDPDVQGAPRGQWEGGGFPEWGTQEKERV